MLFTANKCEITVLCSTEFAFNSLKCNEVFLLHRGSQAAGVNSSCPWAKTSCPLVRLPACQRARETSKHSTYCLRRVAHYLVCTHSRKLGSYSNSTDMASSRGIKPAGVLLFDHSVDPQLTSKNTNVSSISISKDCNNRRTFKETANVEMTHLLSLL